MYISLEETIYCHYIHLGAELILLSPIFPAIANTHSTAKSAQQ